VKLVLAALFVACSHRAPIASCDDDLGGTYVAASGERWSVTDDRATLEAYPLFPDAPRTGDVLAAPRAIDLRRSSGVTMAGTARRRYTLRDKACDARAITSITRCADDTLELVTSDPPPPSSFADCRGGTPPHVQVERWRRE